MIGTRRKDSGRPGGGFLVLLATALVAVIFFAWGLSTPPLEQVWQMQTELALGVRKPLSPSERRLFAAALLEHPELADGMLGDRLVGIISMNHDGLIESGCAFLVARKPEERQTVQIIATHIQGGDPVPIEVTSPGVCQRGVVSSDAPFVAAIPGDGAFPRLIEVRFGPRTALKKRAGRGGQGIVLRTQVLP